MPVWFEPFSSKSENVKISFRIQSYGICCTMIVGNSEHLMWEFAATNACLVQPTMNIFSKGSRLKNHYRYSPQWICHKFFFQVWVWERHQHHLAQNLCQQHDRWCVCLCNRNKNISTLLPSLMPVQAFSLAPMLSIRNWAYFLTVTSRYVQNSNIFMRVCTKTSLGVSLFTAWWSDFITWM